MSDEVTLKDEYDLVGGGHVRYYKVGTWSFEVNSNGDDDTAPEEITEAIDAWCSWHEYVLDNNLHIKEKEAPTMGIPPSDPAQPQSLDYNQGVRDALDDVAAAGLKKHGNVDPEDIYQLRVRYGVLPDKKEAPPVEPSSKDRTDTPEFTPPGEGWKAGEPPLGTSDRYEVVQRWISGGMTATATYHRPLPKPTELPTEDGTVSEVKWKTGRFSSTLLLREGRWFTVPHGAVSHTPEELAQKIDSYEVVSRPMASVAKDVLNEMEREIRNGRAFRAFNVFTAIDGLRKKWGVK